MPDEKDSASELFKAIRDKLAELEDMQLVNKLDIINMKNQMDRISITSTSSPESEEKLSDLNKLVEKVGDLKRFDKAFSDIEKMKSSMERAKLGDIIPLKSEIDILRRKITELESAPAQLARGAKAPDVSALKRELSGLRSELESSKARMEQLEKRPRAAPSAKLPEARPGGLDELKKRLEKLESIRPGPAAAKPEILGGIKEKLEELGMKVSRLESSKPTAAPAKAAVPEDFRNRLAEIGRKVEKLEGMKAPKARPVKPSADHAALEKAKRNIYAEIASLRAALDEQSLKLSRMPKSKMKHGAALPGGIVGRLAALEASFSGLNALKARMEKDDSDISKMLKEMRKPAAAKGQPELAVLKGRILKLEKEMAKVAKLAGGIGAIKAAVRGIESSLKADDRRMGKIDKGLEVALGKAGEDEIEELRNEVQILRASVPEVVKQQFSQDIQEIRAKVGRIDTINDDIGILKSEIDKVHAETANTREAQESLKELKKLKEDFPAKEFMTFRDKMGDIEEKLQRANKLAAGLKPIRLPDEDLRDKAIKDFERRIDSLEKIMGGGLNPEHLKEIEEKIDDLKSNLPQKIGKGTELQLNALKGKMEEKLRELDDMKKEVVESAVEQLLAQPGAINKFLDEKFRKQVNDINEKAGKLEDKISPLDAKVTTLVRDNQEKERDIEKLKESLKEADSRSKSELESLETEVRAMNTRLGTASTSMKHMEGAGVAGIMRDMEILRTKLDWLESTVQKFDLRPLYDKLAELEERTRHDAGGYSPIVIE